MTAAPRLVELVEARLGRLDPEERDLLELLAFGEPLGAGLLERMVAAPALASAERKGLLSVEQAGRRVEVRPVHPLYGEVVRAQTGPLRLRLVQRRLADALEAAGTRRAGDLLRVVTWHRGSGGSATPEQFMLAARQAMALFDCQLAERLARAAVDAGAGLEAEYLVGEAMLALGRVGEAELVLAGLDPRGETDQQRAQFAVTRAFTLYWALNLPTQAKKVLQQAQLWSPSRPAGMSWPLPAPASCCMAAAARTLYVPWQRRWIVHGPTTVPTCRPCSWPSQHCS